MGKSTIRQRLFPAWAGGLLWECPFCAAGYKLKPRVEEHIAHSHPVEAKDGENHEK